MDSFIALTDKLKNYPEIHKWVGMVGMVWKVGMLEMVGMVGMLGIVGVNGIFFLN